MKMEMEFRILINSAGLMARGLATILRSCQ